ncbi:MAG TPA: hypothetical protein VMG39_06140 [Pseudolabrys sp.]|nr:hypothetical protein [Pseudolabrys sp.]
MHRQSRNTASGASSRPQMSCAQCGKALFMPEWSELIDERRVRHLWQCEACDYAFESTVWFAEAA